VEYNLRHLRELIREGLRAQEREQKIEENKEDITHLLDEICLLCRGAEHRQDVGENEEELVIVIKMTGILLSKIFDTPDQVSHFLFVSNMRVKMGRNLLSVIITEICTIFSLEKLNIKENDSIFEMSDELVKELNELLHQYCFEYIECMQEILVAAHKLNDMFVLFWKNSNDRKNAQDCIYFLTYTSPRKTRLLKDTHYPGIRQFAVTHKLDDEDITDIVFNEQITSKR